MTSLSQYLRAERPDRSQHASFYLPGCTEWGGLQERAAWARRADAIIEELYVAITIEIDEQD